MSQPDSTNTQGVSPQPKAETRQVLVETRHSVVLYGWRVSHCSSRYVGGRCGRSLE